MGPTPSKSFNSCCKSLGVDVIAWQSSFWTCLRFLRKQSSHQSGCGGWFLLGGLGTGVCGSWGTLVLSWLVRWVVFSNRNYPWNSQQRHQPPQFEIRSSSNMGNHIFPQIKIRKWRILPPTKNRWKQFESPNFGCFFIPFFSVKKNTPSTHPLLWPSSASPRCLVFDSSMSLRSLRGYALGICNWDFPPLKRTKQNIWLLEINGWKMRFAFGG